MKAKEIITESQIEEQRLDEFLPFILGALGGTAAGATLGDYILQKRKGDKDWSFGQSVGRNLERGERAVTKAAPEVEKFAKDVYKGYTGKDAPEDLDQWLDDVGQAKVPWTTDVTDRIKQRSDADTDRPWTEPDLKEESKKKSDFEIEVEKNFSDPYIRKAIMAKARQESGGRNIGEMDWTTTSNKNLKKAFPQLRKLDDKQLDSLKSQGNEAFLNYAYKDIGGYKYRGRGPIQITGKSNYAKLDKQLGLNGELVKDPDMLLRDPKLANAASVQYLKNAGLHKKTFSDQTSAHQEVIYAIGGKIYAPGSPASNRVLAQIEKSGPGPLTTTAAVTTATTKDNKSGQGAKPAEEPSKLTGPGYDTAGKPKLHTYTGPTVADMMDKWSKETQAKKAAAAAPTEPRAVYNTPTPPKYEPGPNQRGEIVPPFTKDAKDAKADTSTIGQISYPDEIKSDKKAIAGSGYTKLPESVNTERELADILALAGRKK